MTILQLVQKPQLRGAEMFASQLSTHINEKGHKAILVFVFPGKAPLPFAGETRHLNGSSKKRMWDIKAWRNLAQLIKEEKPDIIQANAGDTLKYAVLSKLFFKWKQPIVFRNASTISLYIKTTPAKKLNGFFFKYASRIVSVSRTSATDFAKLFPQFKERIVTVPIGIEEVVLNDPGKENELQGVSKPVLVHVGGFTYEKNHTRLIEIFEGILKKKPGASLHFVGSGPLQGQIEELVKQRGLEQQVRFYGFRNDAMQFIKNADALLLPSIIEGLPGVILEAFYCNTPVVAYNVGGIGEVVINNKTGYLVPKGHEDTFVENVLKAIDKTPENQQMVQNARELVNNDYLNTRIATKFLEVYQSIKK
ncbi:MULTISPECIES: glycosyltransferase family 4 protein [Niastella]|uniref:Glycosyltransferase family 4 protein n=1 Tax=Niastella soli TaxID=2821487 RepID=A0ABS3YLQ6_9BACT|nr:glycosyltransferase family 4 protein [Niastella soli]MBO9198829.1 glycosyltransferase family 4 protein [Niastella soli]